MGKVFAFGVARVRVESTRPRGRVESGCTARDAKSEHTHRLSAVTLLARMPMPPEVPRSKPAPYVPDHGVVSNCRGTLPVPTRHTWYSVRYSRVFRSPTRMRLAEAMHELTWPAHTEHARSLTSDARAAAACVSAITSKKPSASMPSNGRSTTSSQ